MRRQVRVPTFCGVIVNHFILSVARELDKMKNINYLGIRLANKLADHLLLGFPLRITENAQNTTILQVSVMHSLILLLVPMRFKFS